MIIDKTTGLLQQSKFIASPNFDERPENALIELLVIHGISLPPGEFSGQAVCDFFQNKLNIHAHPYFQKIQHLKVSSHLFIRRDGEIIQFVPFHKRAWHAGVSQYKNREKCNDFSVGIELEGRDDLAYTEAQYDHLLIVSKALLKAYPSLQPHAVARHSDIAPGRKTDPGLAFDWDYYRQGLLK